MHSSLKFAASALVTLLLLHTPTAMAGAEESKVAVEKLLKLERDKLLSESSPLADMITAPLRQGNSSVTDSQWARFKSEIVGQLRSVVFRAGGPMDAMQRKRIDALTEAEIHEVMRSLTAPAYVKYMDNGVKFAAAEVIQVETLTAVASSAANFEAIAKKHGIRIAQ
jgi:hypothetical protein